MSVVRHYELVLAIRDAVLLKINNLLSRVTIGNEFSSLMFATIGGFVQFNKLQR